jgi:hypothetical protein
MLQRSSIVKRKNEKNIVPEIFVVGWGMEYDYDYIQKKSLSEDGYWTWEAKVPRVDRLAVECVIYLYETVEHAQRGEQSGGTGCLVGVPSDLHQDQIHIYAVTVGHVARSAPVIRVGTASGKTTVVPRQQKDWVFHPDKVDLAVCPVDLSALYAEHVIKVAELATKDMLGQDKEIFLGDEVGMLGRFMYHDGRKSNIPVVRFGNLAMLPGEPIPIPGLAMPQTCFLVEMHSAAGFSGSPVWIYHESSAFSQVKSWLMGLDIGHTPIRTPVISDVTGKKHPDWYVCLNSGVAALQ